MADQPDRRIWQIKKEISVGDLIAFAAAAIAVITAYTTLDKRMTVLEDRGMQQATTDKRQDDDAVRQQARTEAQLVEINRKLDRIIERR